VRNESSSSAARGTARQHDLRHSDWSKPPADHSTTADRIKFCSLTGRCCGLAYRALASLWITLPQHSFPHDPVNVPVLMFSVGLHC
jgi:hypothetical protein